nr:DUF1499 domain-containing protein [Roseobacter sp.]
MRMIFGGAVLLVLAGLAWVRLAPHDTARWHQPLRYDQNTDFSGGAFRVAEAGPDALQRADQHMRALDRTVVLAGSVEEGRVTYVTRSKVFGFPDYTTIEVRDGHIRAWGRLRFGTSDLGVNRDRLEQIPVFAKT